MSKPTTAETILREALEVILLPTKRDGSPSAKVIAKQALAEADNASPWIPITDNTLPDGGTSRVRASVYEVVDELGDYWYANYLNYQWRCVNDYDRTLHGLTHYRIIEIEPPPLPGSEA